MPRTSVTAALCLAAWPVLAAPGAGHVDRSQLPAGCLTCHQGHGRSNSPMLRAPQQELCLTCHGGQGARQEAIRRGLLYPAANPADISRALLLPYQHPLDPLATSSRQGVTCTSCHAPHRGTTVNSSGGKKLSPKNPRKFEFELCESCHGFQGALTQSLADISRYFDYPSQSFHPVHRPSSNRSPSLRPGLSGKEINCTDCHGNDDPQGPKGPHGSSTRFLLRAPYTTTDGQGEGPEAYALCYRCHQREKVLTPQSPFPYHQKHVVDERASCATCHNGHGSPNNRALIRFGEETTLAGVAPAASGRLQFLSTGPGQGSCFLTCHGKNHDPLSYGPGNPPPPPGTLGHPPGKFSPPSPPGLGINPHLRPR